MENQSPKFLIGNTAYAIGFEQEPITVTCPDCGGTRQLKITLWDGTEFMIDCRTCAKGFEPPTGLVYEYNYQAKIKTVVISGMKMNLNMPVEYHAGTHNCYRTYKEEELYGTREEAEAALPGRNKHNEEAQKKRMWQKEENRRSWAWHVTYHRGEIKRLERDLECHYAKLGIAREKAGHEKEKKLR